MDFQTARSLMIALSNGVDPASGDQLPADHLMHRPEIIRAINTILRAADCGVDRESLVRDLPSNAGQPWTPAEDLRLIQAFDSGRTIPELACEHCRTLGAIRSRLTRLGRLQVIPDAEPLKGTGSQEKNAL